MDDSSSLPALSITELTDSLSLLILNTPLKPAIQLALPLLAPCSPSAPPIALPSSPDQPWGFQSPALPWLEEFQTFTLACQTISSALAPLSDQSSLYHRHGHPGSPLHSIPEPLQLSLSPPSLRLHRGPHSLCHHCLSRSSPGLCLGLQVHRFHRIFYSIGSCLDLMITRSFLHGLFSFFFVYHLPLFHLLFHLLCHFTPRLFRGHNITPMFRFDLSFNYNFLSIINSNYQISIQLSFLLNYHFNH